jgi:thiol-disulfide isomerase/thioredoxin
MKVIYCAFALLLLISCADTSKKEIAEQSNESSEVIQEETEGVSPIARVEYGITVYNFPALDEALLQKKTDTTYVVNFWATWCKPCVKEMPYFEKIASEYSKDKVKVIFVSLDFPDRLGTQVVPFIEKNDIQSEVVLLDDDNANDWIPKVSIEWQGAIPATLIYNQNERAFFERSFTYEELENEVKSLL